VRVRIAEDEAISRRMVEANLRREGYDVLAVETGLQACEALRAEGAPRLAVLDWMMPEMDGAEVCRRVRGEANLHYIYLILLTARGRKEDRVQGFDAGADDYLTKPFELEELLARVKALLRRRRWDGAGDRESPRRFRFGDVTVHFDRFEVEGPRGTGTRTTREMGLLRALITREGEAVKRGELLEEVWGLRADTQTRVIDSFIVRLRRYVEPNPAHPRHIISVRGHGYRLHR